jgi:hypothetical protein
VLVDSKHLGVQMARKEYYPDFDVMAGYYNMGRMKDMWEMKVQVNVPVYFWRKQRYGLEESTLRLVEAQRTYRSNEQMLAFRIRDRFQMAEASRKLMELYSKRVVPRQLALSRLWRLRNGRGGLPHGVFELQHDSQYETSYYDNRRRPQILPSLEELVLNRWISSAPRPA